LVKVSDNVSDGWRGKLLQWKTGVCDVIKK